MWVHYSKLLMVKRRWSEMVMSAVICVVFLYVFDVH